MDRRTSDSAAFFIEAEPQDAHLPHAPRIVAVQGGDSAAIQRLLASCARRWRDSGLRIAGVVEELEPHLRKACGGATLRNLRTGATYGIYQDLGPLSTACCLDAGSFAAACQAVMEDLDACDLVVLSKFGKLEAERGGLLDALIAAASFGKPVLTAVSPAFTGCFLRFVDSWGSLAPVDEAYLDGWARTATMRRLPR